MKSEGTPAGPWWSVPAMSWWLLNCAGSGEWSCLKFPAQMKSRRWRAHFSGQRKVRQSLHSPSQVYRALRVLQGTARASPPEGLPGGRKVLPSSPPLQNHVQHFLFHFFLLRNASFIFLNYCNTTLSAPQLSKIKWVSPALITIPFCSF